MARPVPLEWSIKLVPDMFDALAHGTVWHHRRSPKAHGFKYRLYMSLLDVDRLDGVFAQSRLWSLERFNLVSFRRCDHFGPPDLAVGEAVRNRIRSELGFRPQGPVFMLTHLRQWGFNFNPVTFYFCHHDDRLCALLAEIHNTPWGERHAYVLDCRGQAGTEYRFSFDKRFHVSPFLPMELGYEWRFRIEPDQLDIHMAVTDQGAESFAAGMRLSLLPMTTRAMSLIPLKFPLMTFKVVAGIYWQALRLWLKRTPFHSHPDPIDERT